MLPDILAREGVFLLEHADHSEEQLFLRDIGAILKEKGIGTRLRYFLTGDGEICVMTWGERRSNSIEQ